ncbi:MAG: diadenylate cyclase [Desulfatiglans sp.]|nr:diadenylate cyclase [Thermodesulfobacteriota bacterium]MEE4354403.1 diadenylate cyclase [Desulfatiglans sp.]
MAPIDFILSPTWRDLIDILFLTTVTYQLYLWFRGTRALRVLIGLVALGAIYSIAKQWGLYLTTWVFQFLWQVLLILLLILFQSEIRQVLEKVSPLRYLRFRRPVYRESLPNELAKVLFDLAREKTGALIVIQRDDDPSEFLSAGQSIMSLPEPALIKSIFNHHSPAHDGALVLSEGRLTQMGCILPLSQREDVPDKYGTRHRAAIGLSEQIDAVCLVVSEERAEVSTVVGGHITTWEDPKLLVSKLQEWLRTAEVTGPRLKDVLKTAFTQNWVPKLSTLAVIIAAWFVLASPQQIKTHVTAPIRYMDLSSGLVLDSNSAQTVKLHLSGRRHSIRALKDQALRVNVNLGALDAGTHKIKLSTKNIDLPLGIVAHSVLPQEIEVILKVPLGGQESDLEQTGAWDQGTLR